MNTIALNHRRFKSPSTREINPNTRNKCWNMPDKAADIFESFARRLGISEGSCVRSALAEYIQRRDTWLGLAFRVAAGIKSYTASIFTGSPAERAEAFETGLQAETPELKHSTPTGGARLIEDVVGEFSDEKRFEPNGGK